ncbi:MAG TPA: cell division protein FtsH, partial [Bacteroidota bacterium]
ARKMVCEWGMSDKLGPLAYGAKEEELFLGREITKTRNFSEETAITIDAEVKKIVMLAMKRSEKILRDNLPILHRLSNALLEREILDSTEIDTLMRGGELPPVEKRKNGQPQAPANTTAPVSGTSATDTTKSKK